MKAINKLLYVFIFLLPFQFALNIAPGFDLSVVRVVILFLFSVVVLKSFYKKDFFIPLNIQSVCLILFLLVNIFSLFFAKNIEFGLRKLLFLGSIMPFYFILFDVYKDKNTDDIASFLKTIILGGVLSFFSGLAVFGNQFIWGIDSVLSFYKKIGFFFWGNSFAPSIFNNQSFLVDVDGRDFVRMASFFPDPHNFALFAGVIFFISLVLFGYNLESKISRRKIILYGASSFLSAISVFLSFSRGAYLALLVGCLATVFLWIRKNKLNKIDGVVGINEKLKKKTLLFLAAILLAVFIISPIKNRFVDIFSHSDGSNLGRIQIMSDGLNVFKKHFLFGVGIGNAPIYYNEDIDYRSPVNSHNTYLEVAIENGIIGLGLWLVLIFGTIFSCVDCLNKEKDVFKKYIVLGLIGGMIFFAIHSFFEVFLYSPINLTVLMVLLAFSSLIINKNFTRKV